MIPQRICLHPVLFPLCQLHLPLQTRNYIQPFRPPLFAHRLLPRLLLLLCFLLPLISTLPLSLPLIKLVIMSPSMLNLLINVFITPPSSGACHEDSYLQVLSQMSKQIKKCPPHLPSSSSPGQSTSFLQGHPLSSFFALILLSTQSSCQRAFLPCSSHPFFLLLLAYHPSSVQMCGLYFLLLFLISRTQDRV